MTIFKGLGTAIVTPIACDTIDFEELTRLCEEQISAGTDAIFVLGTTGEPPTMTAEEKKAVMLHVLNLCRGRVKVIVGAGGNNLKECVKFTTYACESGADGILAVTPYYNKCTEKGLIQYYNAIMDASSVGVIAYNVPSRTGVNITLDVAKAISAHEKFAGIKEASGNMASIMKLIASGVSPVYSGDDAMTLPMISLGAVGLISVTANVIPTEMNSLVKLALAGDFAGALEIHNKIFNFMGSMFCEVNPIPIKFAMTLKGYKSMELRAPLTELEDCHQDIVSALYKELTQ
ncbi:MAG: 4-hydroxy-tetrahydrodipicolinate synthase [Bacillota bacterium]